jgi:hypothetical protein
VAVRASLVSYLGESLNARRDSQSARMFRKLKG